MCGIAGIIHWGKASDKEILKRMCNAIAHRGPDDYGYEYLPEVDLGHRRLSIIDLSTAAKQPMYDTTGRYAIVFNGEIYNYREIKAELTACNFQFNNQSDTEVVLNAYRHWGKDCLNKFNGMFAFLIWDSKEKIAFMARDRFGKKPFYYSQTPDGTFYFASEAGALLNCPGVNTTIDPVALNCYLAIGYILAPNSIYAGVKKLLPAHWMEISSGGTRINSGRYWDYSEYLSRDKISNVKSAEEGILHHLEKAIQYRLISDVPVGAFLSGGVDSSSIVAGIRKLHNNNLKTFSIGFSAHSYNELNEARFTSGLFSTEHFDETLNDTFSKDKIYEAVSAFDEPFADNSLIPMAEVSRLAANHVKVVLSGDGADELFAGYITYKANHLFNSYRHIPSPLRKLASRVFAGGVTEEQKIGLRYKLRQFTQGAVSDLAHAHYSWRLHFPPEMRVKIMGENFRQLIYDTDPGKTFRKHFDSVKEMHWLDQCLFVDAMTWLTDDILVKVDRTTMRYSLEARAPYLDKNLVEFAATIHPDLKFDGKQTKKILKSALKKWLPDEVLYRKKSGFNAPVGKWIGNSEGDEFRTFNKFVYSQKIDARAKKTI